MSLSRQLESGIRFIDIRIGFVNDEFHIYHGLISLGSDFEEVMTTVNNFLEQYPSETVIMRLKQNHKGDNNNQSFERVFDQYMSSHGSKVHRTGSSLGSLTLSSLRGKIVILDNFPGSSNYAPISYSSLDSTKQDEYVVQNNWGLYDKWSC